MSGVNQIKPMKGKRKSYLLHINDDLWQQLNEWANQEFRSVNGQIEYILQRAVNQKKKSNREENEGI